MESRLSSRWIYLWIITLLRGVSADPASPPKYILQHTNVSFDQAINDCSPGVLTTLATTQEVTAILQQVSSKSPLEQGRFTYWVGLKKAKNECVVPSLPLRGFKWTADGGEEAEMDRWESEPEETCTTVRCAALTGKVNGSTISNWGLIPVRCGTTNHFICKLRDGQTAWRPESRETVVKPAAPKTEPATPEPATPERTTPEPVTPELATPELATPELATPELATPELATPELATPESKPAAPEPETELKPETGSELQGPDAGTESDPCLHPIVPSLRSLILDPENSSRIQVECWSSVQLELHCSGRPAVWRLLDDSPANFTTICLPCGDGFQKDASGNCVDIDECGGGSGGGPCRHTCLNTEGSYRCVCSDQEGKHHDEDSQACTETLADTERGSLSGILIPVLVAVAALVVLVVVVALTVKCCLMKRSKKRAKKKAEKMAMDSKNGKDSFETANEKTAT